MTGVPPVFVLAAKLPDNVRDIDLCQAGEASAGRGTIVGAQRIRALWRIYPASPEARAILLAKGIGLQEQTILLEAQNPFLIRGAGGQEIPATKLTIGDIPISFSNVSIEHALIKMGISLRSKVKMEEMRDRDGKLTSWLTGRRFAWINLPPTPLPRTATMGPFEASLYHREMREAWECRKCLQKGHSAKDCQNEEVCLTCRKPGHKRDNCPRNKNEIQREVSPSKNRNETTEDATEIETENASGEEKEEGEIDREKEGTDAEELQEGGESKGESSTGEENTDDELSSTSELPTERKSQNKKKGKGKKSKTKNATALKTTKKREGQKSDQMDHDRREMAEKPRGRTQRPPSTSGQGTLVNMWGTTPTPRRESSRKRDCPEAENSRAQMPRVG